MGLGALHGDVIVESFKISVDCFTRESEMLFICQNPKRKTPSSDPLPLTGIQVHLCWNVVFYLTSNCLVYVYSPQWLAAFAQTPQNWPNPVVGFEKS